MEAQELFQNNLCQQFPSDNSNNAPNSDHFIVEEFFDFSNNDDADDAPFISDTTTFDSLTVTGNSIDSSSTAAAVLDSANSSASHPNTLLLNAHDTPFSSDLPVPYDDLVELEWLSNFTEESFSSEEDIQKMQLISGIKVQNDIISEAHDFIPSEQPNRIINPVLNPEISVPAKARSKRTRGPPCNWTSRLLAVSPSESVIAAPKKHISRKKENRDGAERRKCLHCATEKTPQWRTGPMGPKTLCNACGVRYKSGRLVPEYRPAASPTFVLTKHSNSHRKVMELRRQKEMMMQTHQEHQQQQQLLHHHHHPQRMIFDVSHNSDDYFIHQHMVPDFRHLM
ncbi:hypothetical protein PIB30_018273 [Stylosanthes scabra]|uniref:GATA transcription factor n=1 Tax=Stylosanthes scabra TaxID=79078 RepID=A0ABU6X7K7_9FABA|nr:hypothetical protein [Stylosanthes scabra]